MLIHEFMFWAIVKLSNVHKSTFYVDSITEGGHDEIYSSEKLQKLGWRFRPVEETLIDSVESYRKAGILN